LPTFFFNAYRKTLSSGAFLRAQGLEEKLREVVLPVIEGFGIELVDVVYAFDAGGRVLRVLIDKPGGVTVEDCSRVSRELSTILDVEDVVKGGYSLEVSSPGLDRPLIKRKDFENALGKEINVKTKKAIEGRRNFNRVTLEGISEDDRISVKDPEGRLYEIELSGIEKARLEVVI